MLRFSRHAAERMAQRSISANEVEEALAASRIETPGRTARELNLWGETSTGRRLRITVRSDDRLFVITAVAPDEEA